ncbi:hypothetical protein QVD99_004123 [Batrachochytrium dendrobatidis]|nr:hypothetical protein QVD99_004123 [Batrachochytrium dendrobatidis]
MQLDEEEAAAMAESNVGGIESADFVKFKQGGSSNYDDSGFFSVQVICRALQVWNLELRPIGSIDAVSAKNNPSAEQAFICNLNEHWFTLRQFGRSPNRWYDLNSLFKEPKYISETYLAMFISQIQMEGYSIFVILGDLPRCEADLMALQVPIPPPESLPTTTRTKTSSSKDGIANEHDKKELRPFTGTGYSLTSNSIDSEATNLAKAFAASLLDKVPKSGISMGSSNDPDLERAIAANLAEYDAKDITLKRTLEESMLFAHQHPSSASSGSNAGQYKPPFNSNFAEIAATNSNPIVGSSSACSTSNTKNPVENEMTERERVRQKRLEKFQSNKKL